jgi:predicted TIM-barrel fold metal-dependent hydrolase
MRNITPLLLCCLVLGISPICLRAQQIPAPVPIQFREVDCHLHLVDFLQHTDGIQAVLAAMDRSGVDEAMICGMPLVKQWSLSEPKQPQYYLDDDSRCYWYSATDILVARQIETLSAQDRKRFHPFICGFNSDDRNAIEHVKRMLEWYPDVWEGIGEVMTRHDDLTALTYGDVAHADSISLDPLYDLAAEHDMPVSVHSDVNSVWKREPLYIGEIENAVKKHPRTRIIWCHAGVSRRIDVPTLPAQVRRLLSTYPNIYIDLSWVVFETYLTKNGQPVSDWVDLIEAFPNRFMIGSDKVGKFADYHLEMQKYYGLLAALRPETARKVAHDNFLSVLPHKKQALKQP